MVFCFFYAFVLLASADELTVESPSADVHEVIEGLSRQLAQGDYILVINQALQAMRKYPDDSESFALFIQLSSDALARQVTERDEALEQQVRRLSTELDGYYRELSKPRSGALRFQGGVDLVFPTGVRVELNHGPDTIGHGVRVGVNVIGYGGIYPAADVGYFVDLPLKDSEYELEFELSWTYYAVVSAAIQWDPDEAIQANLGVGLGIYGVVRPDIGVTYLW